jgi:hypothetical protein
MFPCIIYVRCHKVQIIEIKNKRKEYDQITVENTQKYQIR